MKKIIAFIIAFSICMPVFAQDMDAVLEDFKENLEPLISQRDVSYCEQTMTPLFDGETLAFLQFLETHFQNKSSNSSLTNIALARFKDYKASIRSYIQEAVPNASGTDDVTLSLDEFYSYSKCMELADSYIALAKEKMISHIQNTNYQKKTTAIVEKYQSINDGLRDLNFKMAELYAYFVTFKNKLPFFVTNCITG
ncbi:hypothetical protein GF354_01275 [Candidatus Peregrinibacteria bacterium]|nr:hypothetical protein [Candidatus Peregrinibacteria bacterium]